MKHNKQISIKLLKHLQELHLTLEKYTAKGGTQSEFLILKKFLEPILQHNSNSLLVKFAIDSELKILVSPKRLKTVIKLNA